MRTLPLGLPCDECIRLARQLEAAWRADNQAVRARLRDVAASSGRELSQFGLRWVFSIATLPDEEMRTLLESHYPRFAEAQRKGEEHEAASGHSLRAWQTLLRYTAGDAE